MCDLTTYQKLDDFAKQIRQLEDKLWLLERKLEEKNV